MLQGIELIDCVKANAREGTSISAQQSGYGQNIDLFKENLIKACQEIGVKINELDDLITDQQIAKEQRKVMDISPDTATEL